MQWYNVLKKIKFFSRKTVKNLSIYSTKRRIFTSNSLHFCDISRVLFPTQGLCTILPLILLFREQMTISTIDFKDDLISYSFIF